MRASGDWPCPPSTSSRSGLHRVPCEDRKTVIDGHKLTVTQMAPTDALALEMRIGPLLLKGLTAALGGAGKSEDDQVAAAVKGIETVFSSLPPDEMAEIITDLCSQPFMDGEKVQFDRDFAGGKGVLLRYRVAWWVLEVNYADFFGEMLPAGALARAQQMIERRMSSAESTGESGDPAAQSPRSAG